MPAKFAKRCSLLRAKLPLPKLLLGKATQRLRRRREGDGLPDGGAPIRRLARDPEDPAPRHRLLQAPAAAVRSLADGMVDAHYEARLTGLESRSISNSFQSLHGEARKYYSLRLQSWLILPNLANVDTLMRANFVVF